MSESRTVAATGSAIFFLCNKNLCYIAHPNLPDVAQWQVKLCVLSESYRAHRLSSSADRVLEDGNFSRYCFLLPSESYVAGSSVVKELTFGGIKVR